ncbi:hypothetical protein Hanom_Chr07g00669201 [Helianthus anomalus]
MLSPTRQAQPSHFNCASRLQLSNNKSNKLQQATNFIIKHPQPYIFSQFHTKR